MNDPGLIEFTLGGKHHTLPLEDANQVLIDHIGAETLKLAQKLADEGLSRDQINAQLKRTLPEWQRWQSDLLAQWSGLLIRRDATLN